MKHVTGLAGIVMDIGIGLGIGLNGVHGVDGMTGAGLGLAVVLVEEVSVHGIERARVLNRIPSQSRVTSVV